MPYMFSQANVVGCTFLLDVNNELKDVAKGSIVQPLHRVFHTVHMPLACLGFPWLGCYRVTKIWILRINPPKPIAN